MRALCDSESESECESVSFYLLFASPSELRLLSRFGDVAECAALLSAWSSAAQRVSARVSAVQQSVMMREIAERLSSVHAFAVWTQREKKSAATLSLPQFHAQPNEYAKAIGTHFLALVQQLDGDGDDGDGDEWLQTSTSAVADICNFVCTLCYAHLKQQSASSL